MIFFRRDTIVTRGDASQKVNKKVLTKGTFERQMGELRKKIKVTITVWQNFVLDMQFDFGLKSQVLMNSMRKYCKCEKKKFFIWVLIMLKCTSELQRIFTNYRNEARTVDYHHIFLSKLYASKYNFLLLPSSLGRYLIYYF